MDFKRILSEGRTSVFILSVVAVNKSAWVIIIEVSIHINLFLAFQSHTKTRWYYPFNI